MVCAWSDAIFGGGGGGCIHKIILHMCMYIKYALYFSKIKIIIVTEYNIVTLDDIMTVLITIVNSMEYWSIDNPRSIIKQYSLP